MVGARTARALAVPMAIALALGGCVETRPFSASGTAPKGPATYRVLNPDMIAPPVRAALDGQLAQRGLQPATGETADWFVSVSFSDRPLHVGAFAGDARPEKADPAWIDDPAHSGKRERRMMVRFADRTGGAVQSAMGTEIVRRKAKPTPPEGLIPAIFAALQ